MPILPLLIDDSRDLVHTELDALFLDDLGTSIEKRTSGWLDGMDVLNVGEGGDEDRWKEGSIAKSLASKLFFDLHLFLSGTIEELTPWYSYYREAVFNRRPRTEYETFGHPVACEAPQD